MNCNGKTALVNVELGDEIVISGIAGRFPESDNIKHLQKNLFNKVDLGSNDYGGRWQHDYLEMPKRIGKINNIEKFDSEYFDIPFNQAHLMDPSIRCILEHTYEAIVDAGVNPKDLYGTKTGMFVATSICETEKNVLYDKTQLTGSGILGCSKAMQANWVSHMLGIKGPSFAIDTACSSSLYAIEAAYRIIRSGQCDAMIVAASNICLHPSLLMQFALFGVLSRDGFCKSFDVNASGYMRSDTVAVVYLQKAKNAKRIYATLVYAKTNSDGFKEEGLTFPSSKMQTRLMQEFYDECGISPSCMNYVEAHATGTRVGDPEEVKAIEKVFCKDRRNPLLIGSVKSNMGHSEPAAGLCQVAKVVTAMETGIIPPNINLTKVRPDIEAFKTGTIRVITDSTLWKPTFVGINSFGAGGTNAHILLAPNMKEKINGGAPKDDLPRLIVLSGRTKQAVESFLREIESQPVDIEYVRLLHDLFADEMRDHPYRGYTIVESETSDKVINEVEYYSGEKMPICFVFSGLGSQWLGMGKALLRFPVFLETVKKCDTILRDFDVHIIDIIIGKEKATFDSILNSVVAINVIQLGLIDLLTSVNITPNYIIGHSIGELCCGYITGDFTIEQVILSAYYIGLALEESKIVHYAMADIGLGYKDTKDICSPDIKIICNYSLNTCSIIGPIESIKTFTKKLEIKKIFYKEVNCCNIPLHSCYLAPARDKILDYLYRVIPQKMLQSYTWRRLSCDTDLSYAEYFTDNLVNPVTFKDVAKLIPENVAFIEIAPDGILQGVLMELFDTTTISLAQRDCKDNVKIFLQGLGKMYNCGLQPQLANLYPTVEFPVSRGTPMISPSIKWKHSEDWYVASYLLTEEMNSGVRTVNISLQDEDYEYMKGHVLDGRNLLPGTGYIFLIWETISMLHRQRNVPVVMENIKFLRATHIPDQGSIELIITVQKATGTFEIIEGNIAVVTGNVRISLHPDKERVLTDHLQEENNEEEILNTKDIYKELKLRGYQYADLFRGLISSSTTATRGHIAWLNNWAAFIDCMAQFKILSTDTRNLCVGTNISKIVIDPHLHAQHIENITTEDKQLPVHLYKNLDTIICGGVEMSGVTTTSIYRRKPTRCPVLEENRFVAHRDRTKVSFEEGLILSLHLVLEYHQVIKADIIELIENGDEITLKELASPLFVDILNNYVNVRPNISLVTRNNYLNFAELSPIITISQSKMLSEKDNSILVTGCNLLISSKRETLKEILYALKPDGFLLTRGQSLTAENIATAERYNLAVVLEKQTENEHITLLKKKGQWTTKTEVICVNNYGFSWLEKLKATLSAKSKLTDSTRIVIVGERDEDCGILGLVNCLRKEPGGELIRGVFIQDENAPKFSVHDSFYAKQLQMDLIMNVLRPGKVWGSYRFLPLKPLKPKFVYHALVNQMVRGDLSSIRWIEGAITPDYKHGNHINIIYSSLNFKDVMVATGKINTDNLFSRGRLEHCIFGMEFAGIDDAGRRVMGVYRASCISNRLLADRDLLWEIPDKWTLEDAATIPLAYATCYYGIYFRGKLKKSDKILIHSGTGAVGQAAIRIALHEGCEIFTTVGTAEKKRFIKNTFPSIPEDHIGNSRDTSFQQMIHQKTNGRGVDLVLNSLAEDKLQASVRCLARGGRFLEIGKFDMLTNNTLDMSVFSKGIRFYSVMLDRLFCIPQEERHNLHGLLADGLDSGAIKPITRKVFQKDEVEAAFRYMAAGKHIGKIIIKVQDENKPIGAPFLALPRYYCLPNRSYIILGGLGGFGVELADWLVIRGAKNLVLISRTGVKNGYQRMRIQRWESYGVKVFVSNVDVSDVKDCENILEAAEKLAPTDAIFNLAAVLNDKICLNHTVETFQEPFRAKAWATKNLDQLSRKICPQLRHFVVFSSASCGKGNAEQSNYGMANSVVDRICERRSQEGLHGLAIQWGAIGDVGMVADMQEDDKEMVIGGAVQQKISSCIEKLEEFLLQEQPVVASMVVAEKHLNTISEISIVTTVATIMGLKNLSAVSRHVRLSELGMDSMMATEVKQTLERGFGVFLPVQDIRNLSFAKLDEIFNEKSQNEEMLSDKASNENNLTGLQLLIRTMGKDNLISDHVMDRIKSRKNFVIVAYSYGSVIGIELTKRLEEMKLQGRLLLIDGAPDLIKALATLRVPYTTTDELQNKVLENLMDILEPAVSGKLLMELKKYTNWEDKLNIFINHLSPAYGKLKNSITPLCITIYNHVRAIYEYDMTQIPKIVSPVILLKPTSQSLYLPDEDYGLHKITTGNVQVHCVEGDHVTMLDSDIVTTAINGKQIESNRTGL